MSASVFPARAGMSPSAGVMLMGLCSVPRASGDEPTTELESGKHLECSPRERG